MQRLHARYPFLEAAREAVETADVDLTTVIREGGPAVERGVERVERALVDGTVAADRTWSVRAELLSYPIARVLVSLVDIPGAVEKYARAEAALAYERFTDDFEAETQLQSAEEGTLSLSALLADFDAGDTVRPTGDGAFSVAVGTYLRLAAPLEGSRWRLATRVLADGEVIVRRTELYELLREAVRVRVLDPPWTDTRLPLSVSAEFADALAPEVEQIRRTLVPVERPDGPNELEITAFPPCVVTLLRQARDGEAGTTGRFALLAFLASTGADFDQVAALVPDASGNLRRQYERLADDDGAQFAPPSCETMQANGDCHDPDTLCEEITHPLAYYERRLEPDE
ncbi:DNA primase [Halosegnis sp.]|uniref:DNA primase n=1 Tax=Halosegnis sp. TaxID=2864959 RepID=UPI0035D3EAF4